MACSWDHFPPIKVPKSSLDMRVCAKSYCNLLYCVRLIFPASLLFSEGNGGAVDLWERGCGGGLRRVEGEKMAVSMYCMEEEHIEKQTYSIIININFQYTLTI